MRTPNNRRRLFNRISLTDKFTILSTVITAWGLVLTFMYADQKQTIEDFDVLLKRMQEQTEKLTEQVEIAQSLQARANLNDYKLREGYANKLSSTINSLLLEINKIDGVTQDGAIIPYESSDELLSLKKLLELEVNNQFLMEDSLSYALWIESENNTSKVIIHLRNYDNGTREFHRKAYLMFMPRLKKAISKTREHLNANRHLGSND